MATLSSQNGYGDLLRNRSFLFLWLGQVASQLGDRIVFVAFIAMITATYGANDAYNSGLYIAFTLPAIALTALAGVFVDRWQRRPVLVITNLIRAAVVALLPLALQTGLWAVYGVAFMVSMATQFFVPAESASIPALVPKEQLILANSLFTTTMMMSVVLGFSLSDPLISWLGLHSVHWAIVGLFVVASVLLTQVSIPFLSEDLSEKKANADKTLKQAVIELGDDLAEGIAYLRANRNILNWILKLALLFSVVVSMCIVLISFAREFLYADPAVAARKFAHIITVSGLGMGLGSVFVKPLLTILSPSRLVAMAMIALSAVLALLMAVSWFSSTHLLWPDFLITDRIAWTYGVALCMGISAACIAIPAQSEIHRLVAETVRGKIMGLQFTLLSTSSTLPVIITGLGMQYVGIGWMIALLSVPLAIVGLISFRR